MPPATKAQVSTAGAKKPRGGQAKVFGFTTTGTQNAAAVLESIGGRGADARPAWPYLFQLLQADTAKQFEAEPWQKLADATVETKKSKGLDPRILRAKGALYKSLTADRGKGAMRRKSRYQMRYGTTVFYAFFHQEGKGVPKRVMLDVDAALQRHMVDALERYVTKGDLPERLRAGGGGGF